MFSVAPRSTFFLGAMFATSRVVTVRRKKSKVWCEVRLAQIPQCGQYFAAKFHAKPRSTLGPIRILSFSLHFTSSFVLASIIIWCKPVVLERGLFCFFVLTDSAGGEVLSICHHSHADLYRNQQSWEKLWWVSSAWVTWERCMRGRSVMPAGSKLLPAI